MKHRTSRLHEYSIRRNWMGYVLIAPAVLSILLLSIYPLINGVGISLLNYNITRSKDPSFGTFAGIKNYITIFTDHNFQQAAGNTVLWVLTNVIFQVLFALLIALTLNQKLKGRSFFRTMSLIPWAIPSVVSALTFSFLYDSKVGIFNILLQKSGIISKPISWLGNIETVMPSVIVSTIWKGTPFLMIFILAALQGIPEEVYESSGIDGAGKLRTFFSITLPMIKEPVSVAVILNVISIFNNFNAIWLLTEGGPLGSTEILYTYSYREAFLKRNFGTASASSVVIFVIIAILTILYIRFIEGKEYKK